jgi:methionyl-tRNA formyltransferase
MKKISEPIVFFGSGPVAAASLRLLAQDFIIESVVTKPRAPHHKGPVPVIELAKELNIPLHTVSSKKELDMLVDEAPFKAQLGILIDFGIIVSQKVIDYFPLGIINSHFSLLPEWRGADPITFSILSGQPNTGVSLMLLTAGMDEGPLIAYGGYNLSATVTTPQLTEDLIELSHALLSEMVPQHFERHFQGVDQRVTGREESYSRKLTKADSVLDWQKPADVLEREVRAFIEWPKSHAAFGTIEVIITKAHVAHQNGPIGTTTIIDKKPAVYCTSNALVIDAIKPAGKKEMTGEGFLAGYKSVFLGN